MLPRLSFLVLSKKQDLDQTLESSAHIELELESSRPRISRKQSSAIGRTRSWSS